MRLLTYQVADVAAHLEKSELIKLTDPVEINMNMERPYPPGTWIDKTLGFDRSVSAIWREPDVYIHSQHPPLFAGTYRYPQSYRSIGVVNADKQVSLEELMRFLEDCPFEICSWKGGPADRDRSWEYRFSHHLVMHSAGCAFKGDAGHSWLASRRWLEHGPWKLHYGKNDLTFVQFYDYEAELPVLREQAETAHRRMGRSPTGGYLDPIYRMPERFPGDYYHESKSLVTRVFGRELGQEEMLQAAILRRFQLLGPEMPIEHVIFEFADPKEGYAYLHELWLRGLTCVTYINGAETDISADYDPEPDPPQWTKKIPTIDLRWNGDRFESSMN